MGEIASRFTPETGFLEHVFGKAIFDDFPDLSTPITQKPSRAVDWFNNLTDAGDFCHRLRKEQDLYFTLALFDRGQVQKRNPKGRGTRDEVKVLLGFGIDLDVMDAESTGANKNNIFEDREEIYEFVQSLELHPSMLVGSGEGGVHAHWLFHEPWELNSPEDLEAAVSANLGWFFHVSDRSTRHLDHTQGINRIWRIPGTYNHKYIKDPVMVELLDHDPKMRYDPEDFEAWRVAESMAPGRLSPNKALAAMKEKGVTVNRVNMKLPRGLGDEIAIDKELAKVWWPSRSKRFDSNSERDLSIASRLHFKGFNEQQIVDSLVIHRSLVMDSVYKKDDDYFLRTVNQACGTDHVLTDMPDKGLLEEFSRIVGLPITAVFRSGDTSNVAKPLFHIELKGLEGKRFLVGNIAKFRKQTTWADIRSLNGFTSQGLQQVNNKTFAFIVDEILMKEVKDITERDQLPEVELLGYVLDYTRHAQDLSDHKGWVAKAHFTIEGLPFYSDGYLFLSIGPFQKWMKDNKYEVPDRIHYTLRAQGFTGAGHEGGTAIPTYRHPEEEGTKKGQTSRSYYTANRERLDKRLALLLEQKGRGDDDE